MTRLSGEAPPQASSRHSPEEAADSFLKRLPASCRLLVAFSGGGDSTGLLAALSDACRAYPGVALHAAIVDHGLRSGSAEEAQAASLVSLTLGVPHAILQWIGEKPSTGIQAAARAARYRLLAAEAERIGADFIVTGHTLDDQSETIVMRGLRNPAAAEGMDEAVLVERRVWTVRPFLEVSRAAIRHYLLKRRLSWSEDPSNDNPAFERVRLRQSDMSAVSAPAVEHKPKPYILAAQFVRDHVEIHPGPVAVVDLRACRAHYHPHWLALATLAAIVGGRVHGPGSETETAIIKSLEGPADFRTTANRALFDRRGQWLYLHRENRGLSDLAIAPGTSARWDGRYEITNRGSSPVTVGAGRGRAAAAPLLPLGSTDALPNDVAKRVAASMPRVIEGDGTTLSTRMVLAPFDKFLPARKLELANGLAAKFELEQFPLLSLGHGAF